MVTVQDIIKDCRDAAHTYKGFDRPVEPASVVAIYERIAASLERVLAQGTRFSDEQLDRAALQLFLLDNNASRWPSVNQVHYRKEAKSILDAAFTSTNGR